MYKILRILKSPILFLLVISLGLTIVWFRHGNLMGGGEIGIQFYNLSQMVGISVRAWGTQALGGSSGLTVAGAPLYSFYNFFQKIGIPGFIEQASFFVIAFFLTLYSSYLLIKEIFPSLSKKAYIAASIFYLVNPYALVNIWNRFLPNPILFYAFLPLGLLLFLKGLKKRNYVYAVIAMLLTAILSYGFAGPSQTIIFWSILSLFAIYYSLLTKEYKFVILFLLAGLGSWFVFNFFWVSQELYFRFSSAYGVASQFFFTNAGNFETFNTQSKVLGTIANLLLLRHMPFFTQSVDLPFKWPLLYSNILTLLIQWSILVVVLLVAIKKRKETWVGFLLFLFFAGVFVSKGNSLPIGDFLDLLFKRVSFLEFFRNPFEKLGLILALSLSLLFGLAVDEVDLWSGKLKGIWRFLVKNSVWFYLIVFLGFPFWTGLVFSSGNPPANNPEIGYDAEPPSYYREADNYLSSQTGIFRFITFPLGGEGIFNTWPKGYTGVEQSGVLFSTPSISYNTNIPYYNSIVSRLESLFMNNINFYEIGRLMNVKYLVFRPDFDFELSNMRDPQTIDKFLSTLIANGNSMLKYVANFGPLKVFKYDDSTFLPKIYAADEYILNNNISFISDVLLGKTLVKPAIYSISGSGNDQGLPGLVGKESAKIVHSSSFFYISNPFPQESNDPNIFPHVNTLADSKFYPLILLKEQMIEVTVISLEDKTNLELMMLGKRLQETKLSMDKGDIKSARKSLLLYEKSLPIYLSKVETLSITAKLPSDRIWHEGEIFKAFSAHIFCLNQLAKTSLNTDGFVTNLINETNNRLATGEVLPIHKIIVQDNFPSVNRVVYQLNTFSPGEYEILIPSTKFFPSKFNFGKKIVLQVDGYVIEREITIKNSYVSFGKYYFNKGLHEVGFNQGERNNLIEDQTLNAFNINTGNISKEIVIPLGYFDPRMSYLVSFDYKIIAGSDFVFGIQQNIDKKETERGAQTAYFHSQNITFNGYWHDWSSYQTLFVPQPYTDSANLKILVQPWNNCRQVYPKSPNKCLDMSLLASYQRPTQVSIRDLKVIPNIPQEMILLETENNKLETPKNINFERVDSTKYKVHITGANQPFILVFSELYDAGWKISNYKHFLINGYANGWWIDKTGDYDLEIEYAPQKILNVGYIISGTTALIAIIIVLVTVIWKKNNEI
jgi:hypothetical protein